MSNLKKFALSSKKMNCLMGGRERVVETRDLDGDGHWDLKIVSVYNDDGELVRQRIRVRR